MIFKPVVLDWGFPCRLHRCLCGNAFHADCRDVALCTACLDKLIDRSSHRRRNFDELPGFDRGCYDCGAAWGDYTVSASHCTLRPRCIEGHWFSLHIGQHEKWTIARAILEAQ